MAGIVKEPHALFTSYLNYLFFHLWVMWSWSIGCHNPLYYLKSWSITGPSDIEVGLLYDYILLYDVMTTCSSVISAGQRACSRRLVVSSVHSQKCFIRLVSLSLSLFSMAQQPLVGYSLPIIEASRSHPDTAQSLELLRKVCQISPSQKPLPDNTQHSQETDIHAPIWFQQISRLRSHGTWNQTFIW
jgi:hypothetical protein